MEKRQNRRVEKEFKQIYDQLDSKEIMAFEKIKLRKRRRKRFIRRMQLAVVLICILFISYLISPLSKIRSLNIYDNKIISSASIIEASGVVPNSSLKLFTFNFMVSERVSQNPFIKTAEVKMVGNGQMNIMIKEQRVIFKTIQADQLVAYFEDGSSAVVPKGYTIDAATVLPLKNNNLFSYEELAQKLATVPPEIVSEISEIEHTPSQLDENRFTFYMKDRNRIIILMTRIDTQLKWYFKIVEQSGGRRIEYVMEYAGDVFGRFIP
ncbi:MAG: cell division protein FtsQ/DivIB [Culicoidibacterales bacterium]